ncbi:transposase [Bradyrhizobium sp. CCGUVB23]|uniref:IS701 family transposase n=1 Tax=Bradyrhizobium sp. CCGUVB23 TaxID=2949630 RepID=UPI0020B31115|nr:transposase [Bradyrhizobium sp. CCGUVB23]MCP3468222.1 transposase [Bradyrhizobium sp. CCGUVB23]
MSQLDEVAAIQHADFTDGMQHARLLPRSCDPLPPRFAARLAVFTDLFTRPTWPNVLMLLAGVILAPSRRTVTAALRILGRERDPDFCTFHRVLNRAAWSSRAAAGRLLLLLIKVFVADGEPVVIGLDDTIERRWGPKISARGIYRDPVRSSKGHFVKASGLRWLSAMLLVRVPWADRIMALPFLTLLAPSKRFYDGKSRSPKTPLDWARQAAWQIHRWLPDRYIVLVADSAFAAIEFLAAVRKHVCIVTRLRLDANLFEFPRPKRKARGRPPIRGKPHKKLSAILKDRNVSWTRYRVSLWYGRTNRTVEIATGTALWYRGGVPPVPIRWLLVRDPTGELDPQAFLATDLNAHPRDILAWFVSRWQVEVTFEEVRAHLGVETQRQWSDKAILRSTPILLGLYSIITLWTHDLAKARKLKPRTAAWYPKATLTFSDAIAAVRRQIWAHQISFMSRPRRDSIEIPRHLWPGWRTRSPTPHKSAKVELRPRHNC